MAFSATDIVNNGKAYCIGCWNTDQWCQRKFSKTERSFRGWWPKVWLCLGKTWTETCPKNVTVLHGLHVKTPKIKCMSIIHTISTVFLFISYWYRTGKIDTLWAASLCCRTTSHILVQLMVLCGPSFEFYGFELCKKPSWLACIRHMLQMTINLHNIVSSFSI